MPVLFIFSESVLSCQKLRYRDKSQDIRFRETVKLFEATNYEAPT